MWSLILDGVGLGALRILVSGFEVQGFSGSTQALKASRSDSQRRYGLAVGWALTLCSCHHRLEV